MITTKKTRKHDDTEKARQSHNAQIARMMEEAEQADKEERATRQKKQNLMLEGLKEQTITHSITRQIRTETNQLIGDIMHGSRSNDPKRPKPSRADIKAMNNIFYKQRA